MKNPHVVIIPQLVGSKDPNNGQRTGNLTKRVDDPDDQTDMLIGMDILRKLHLYIAFDESRIYISEASAPPKLEGRRRARRQPALPSNKAQGGGDFGLAAMPC